MKLSPYLLFALFAGVVTNVAVAEENGQDLFNKMCVSCHVSSGKPTLAPPIFGVVNHVKSAHPDKQSFVNFIVNWVAHPDADVSVMPGAIRKFGLMPALPYKEFDVRLISEYLYDGKTELPAWYIEHYKAEHGQAPTQ